MKSYPILQPDGSVLTSKEMKRANNKTYRDRHRNKILTKQRSRYNENSLSINDQARKYYKEHTTEYKQYRKQAIERWYILIESNGFHLKCARCGYSRCREAIDFHHVLPGTKGFGLGDFVSRNKSFTTENQNILFNELRKGIFLCRNCHAEEHYMLKNGLDTIAESISSDPSLNRMRSNETISPESIGEFE